MQWGIHHYTAACKYQQKRDGLTLHQSWYQSWRQCVTPLCVSMPLSRSDQPSWPTHWPRSCQYQTHCLQQIPYTSVWCTLWAHHLAARLPWLLTPQGKLILVCHRHPWSCHPGSTLKWETGSHEDELCHHNQVTQHTSCTCFYYSSHNQAKSIRSTDDLIKEFPDQFKDFGRFTGKYKIWLHHDTHPVIHAPRICPITLCPKVKEHLNKMECLGVITHVDEPTDWVSSITYVQEANGKLCLCLDPHDLNEAICHDHHKMPTVEEVSHEFVHSCFFTKLDAHHWYWSIVPNQDSSLLMTFNSPFRRCHFLQLPFGLVCSQDIFQKKMDQILKECQGCIGIADDITVHGCTKVEHDACLWDLMHIAHKYNLVFNPQKTHVKAQAINFFGCLYNANGVHPDPGKVNAVHTLLAPTNFTELQEFLGLVTYLSPFIPRSVHLDHHPMRATQEEHRLHMELHLWHQFSVDQGSHYQWYHPQVLQPLTPCDNTGWCLTGRPWCSTPAKWQTHSLCQQGPHWNWTPICKHRERC